MDNNQSKKKYYITTPIYYPSSNLHVGHTYCTVMADAMARFKRLAGYDVRFLTGTDEHGQKIQQVADERGVTPQQHVDEVVGGIKDLWAKMEISYDDFIRTTEDRHKVRVQEIFRRIYEKGDIYRGQYEGWYCTPCETFWTDTQLDDGKCPDCGRPVEWTSEDAYFFRLSAYADKLLTLYKEHPEFLEPESRRNEMTGFIKQGLEDLCISRSSFDWGIPVPIEENQVIYVWLDALSNYVTALGWPTTSGAANDLYERYWPADVHLVGKEIVRFHSIIWPAMLMSLDEPLPRKVLGHGWLLLEGGKMSKSKGNVVDPVKLIERYGVDALKYFLLREYTFGQDGIFANEALLGRLNADLANDLGNLLSRTTGMAEKFRGGKLTRIGEACAGASGESTTDERIPVLQAPDRRDQDAAGAISQAAIQGQDGDSGAADGVADADLALKSLAVSIAAKVERHMDEFAFNHALEEIWTLVRRSNKYIDETAPWVLAKDAAQTSRLDAVLYNLAEALRIISILIHPFMHWTSEGIRAQLGLAASQIHWDEASVFGLETAYETTKGENLFPRLDIEAELEALAKIAPGASGASGGGSGDVPDGAEDSGSGSGTGDTPGSTEDSGNGSGTGDTPGSAGGSNGGSAPASGSGGDSGSGSGTGDTPGQTDESGNKYKAEIEYDVFDKLDLRVGLVESCMRHPDADKLLIFRIKMGDEVRQIVSGVAQSWAPGDCIGRRVIVVANLKPRMLRGEESKGMLLFADNGDRYEFVTTDAPDGEQVT